MWAASLIFQPLARRKHLKAWARHSLLAAHLKWCLLENLKY
jgi:hypothetical protein